MSDVDRMALQLLADDWINDKDLCDECNKTLGRCNNVCSRYLPLAYLVKATWKIDRENKLTFKQKERLHNCIKKLEEATQHEYESFIFRVHDSGEKDMMFNYRDLGGYLRYDLISGTPLGFECQVFENGREYLIPEVLDYGNN